MAPPVIKTQDSLGKPIYVPIPWWLLIWIGVVTLAVAVTMFWLWHYSSSSYKWNMQMRRWAAHYYYCDSGHRDDAKCAQWSNHIPPPPPPPKY